MPLVTCPMGTRSTGRSGQSGAQICRDTSPCRRARSWTVETSYGREYGPGAAGIGWDLGLLGLAALDLVLDVLREAAGAHRPRDGVGARALSPLGVEQRGVHDDHRAACVVADPVRHVAEHEPTYATHPAVADDDQPGVVTVRLARDDFGHAPGPDHNLAVGEVDLIRPELLARVQHPLVCRGRDVGIDMHDLQRRAEQTGATPLPRYILEIGL